MEAFLETLMVAPDLLYLIVIVAAWAGVLALFGLGTGPAAAAVLDGVAVPAPDLVIHNARVTTQNPGQPEAEAVAVRDGNTILVISDRRIEDGRIPIDSEEDFAFLTAALPMRGYNYNARIVTRYGLGNAELRFPVVKYFLGGVLPYILQTVNGAIFLDVGAAIDTFENFKAFERDPNGNLENGDLLIGTGFGARLFAAIAEAAAK